MSHLEIRVLGFLKIKSVEERCLRGKWQTPDYTQKALTFWVRTFGSMVSALASYPGVARSIPGYLHLWKEIHAYIHIHTYIPEN